MMLLNDFHITKIFGGFGSQFHHHYCPQSKVRCYQDRRLMGFG